ncbi:hypothetical protein [Paraferrimonas sp. SM1919]|uniref:hypothetical protein n=1 Tax=Paraferrimonas sp. SM1919 TaxID=2662263 RepID=UPI0013CF938D|nr:hypothetical protein [Paraferrimonas sp. SM1919]
MEVHCSICKRGLDSEHINVAKDTAYCQSCNRVTSLSSLLAAKPSRSFSTTQAGEGIEVSDDGYKWSIEASNRSLKALFLVPFTLVWAGGSLSGIYGTQLFNGEFDLAQSLFGLPFIVGSIVLITITMMSLFGRTAVSYENDEAVIFIGIGSLGWYRRFDWKKIDKVTENELGQHKHISLEGQKRINFGWGLSSEKLYYMSNFLKTKLK